MEAEVGGVELERQAELINIRIAVRKQLARELGGAAFTTAGGGKKRRHRAFGIGAGFLHAGEFEEHRLPFGQKLERPAITRSREIELVALFGKSR